jgi:membrane protein YqaA with SNARE-associated domain
LFVVLIPCILLGISLSVLLPTLSGLIVFALYCVPANSLLPLPHEPGLLYFAEFYSPWSLAIAGALGAAVGACTDYWIMNIALRPAGDEPGGKLKQSIERLRNAEHSQKAIRWFLRRPFVTTFVFALTPLPMHFVRVLAPASGYSRNRYVLAIVLGCMPRFYLVALLGHQLSLPPWFFVLLFISMVAASTVAKRRQVQGGRSQ